MAFGMFVTHEMYRDRAKDLADTIEQAQTTSTLSLKLERVNHNIDDVDEEIMKLTDNGKQKSPEKSFEYLMHQQDIGEFTALLSMGDELEDIHDLFAKLPYNMADDDRYQLLRRAIDNELHTTELQLALYNDQDTHTQSPFEIKLHNELDSDLQASISEDTHIENLLGDPLESALPKYIDHELTQAKLEEEKEKKTWKFCTHLGWVLYSLSLSIGLYAAISKDQEAMPELSTD